ncbi:MAG: CHAP domain-containing protein [Nocardioidaceae bacterium]
MTSRLRAFAAFLALVLTGGLGLVAGQAPASAASTVLCTGYSGCLARGMSEAGYASANRTMYWRMYAGHNCTNYVAYRMVRGGMPNVRPWTGGGNASQWGLAMASITNSVPTAGSVAWWGAYAAGHGSAGHVAYVEQVISPDEIIVSQDSWGGDFSWARITRSSGRWPSGFVHLNDQRISSLAAPTVVGTAKVGGVLTALPGTWTPGDVSLRYVWKADGVNIPGITGATLPLTLAQQGKQINVRVIATKTGYPAVGRGSARTGAVLPGVISSTAAPVVSGTPQVDQPLQADAGSWDPQPDAVSYQWTADGLPIPDATSPTFTPGPDQVGRQVSVTVTATKAGYTDVPAASVPTVAVAPGTFAAPARPALRLPGVSRRVQPGQTLSLGPDPVTPGDGTVAVQWLRGGVPIDGATGTEYTATADDLGQRLSAEVTLSKPGYTTRVRRTVSSWAVRTPATLTTKLTNPHKGRMRMFVRVDTPDVRPVTGTVTVRSRGRVLAELALHGRGWDSTVLKKVAPGSYRVVFRYPATQTVMRGVAVAHVRVE